MKKYCQRFGIGMTYRFILIWILFGIEYSTIKAQDIELFDSLKIELSESTTKLERVKLQNLISEFYNNQGNYDSGKYYANLALNQYENIHRLDSANLHEYLLARSNLHNGWNQEASTLEGTARDSLLQMVLREHHKTLDISIERKAYQAEVEALNNLGQSYNAIGNIGKSKEYYLTAISKAQAIGFEKIECWSSYNLAQILVSEGSYAKAIEYYFVNLAYDERLGDDYFIAMDKLDIGRTFIQMGDLKSAESYLLSGLRKLHSINDKTLVSGAHLSLGKVQFLKKNGDSALYYYRKNAQFYSSMTPRLKIDNYLSMANAFQLKFQRENNQNFLDSIETWSGRAVQIISHNKLAYLYPEGHLLMAYYHGEVGNRKTQGKFIDLANSTLDSSSNLENRLSVVRASADYYGMIGNFKRAYDFKNAEIQLWAQKQNSDEIRAASQYASNFAFSRQQLADSLAQEKENLQLELKHQATVNRKTKNLNILGISALGLILLAIALISRNKHISNSRKIIEKERDRSDNLLLNILPAEIAKELKEKGEADARDYQKVSILFTDFIQFTEVSEKMAAKDLVAEIDFCFKAFDKICEKYEVEKIKTIGDSYMASGGLPIPKNDSVINTIRAAIEMQSFIEKRKLELTERGFPAFEMRSGIHTGPVVAGIVGVKKFQYDIWGDTVNTASRMESHGQAGKVNISQKTYELLTDKSQFVFERRGEIEVKGKGEMEMWFVGYKSVDS